MAVATGTALLIGTGIAAAGAVGGAIVANEASKDAAREQRRALQSAADREELGFQRAQELQQPFLQRGGQAFNTLADIIEQEATKAPQTLADIPEFTFGLQDIQNDPAIRFAQEQARKSVLAGSTATGSTLGGGTLKELQDRAIGLSNLQSQQAFNRKLGGFQQNLSGRRQLGVERGQAFGERQQTLANLAQIANLGPQTASSLSNLAVGHAGRLGDLDIQGGNINAAREIAEGQAINQGISGATSGLQDLILLQGLNKKIGTANPIGSGDLAGLNQGLT